MTISPLSPNRMSSIRSLQHLDERGLAPPSGILVVDPIDHLLDQMDSKPPRSPLLDGSVDPDLRHPGDIEGIDVEIGQADLDPIVEAPEVQEDLVGVSGLVLHHVGEKLLDREPDGVLMIRADPFPREEFLQISEDTVQRIKAALEGPLHEIPRPLTLPRAADPRAAGSV